MGQSEGQGSSFETAWPKRRTHDIHLIGTVGPPPVVGDPAALTFEWRHEHESALQGGAPTDWVHEGLPFSYENSEPQTFDITQKSNGTHSTIHWVDSGTFDATRTVNGWSGIDGPGWTSAYNFSPLPYSSPLHKPWSVDWSIEPGYTWYYQMRFMMIDGKETWYSSSHDPAVVSRTRAWADYYMDDATSNIGPDPGGGGGGAG